MIFKRSTLHLEREKLKKFSREAKILTEEADIGNQRWT